MIGWELLKFGVKSVAGCNYYKRESEAIVMKIRVMPWDRKSREHVMEQGYSRKYPARAEEK